MKIYDHIDGLVQDCSISSALAMEILQSCTKPLILGHHFTIMTIVDLLWPAQICDQTGLLEASLKQMSFSRDFSYELISFLWNGSQYKMHLFKWDHFKCHIKNCSFLLFLSWIIRCFFNFIWTLLVLKPEYTVRIGSIPWLLMPWLLVSPGHQQPSHWLCRINKSSSSIRKDFNNLRRLDGLMQDCSNSSALAMDLLQSCTKPSISVWES